MGRDSCDKSKMKRDAGSPEQEDFIQKHGASNKAGQDEFIDMEAVEREVLDKKRSLRLGQGKFFDMEAERNEIIKKHRALRLAQGELFGIEGGSNVLISKRTVLEAKNRIGDLGYGNRFKPLGINDEPVAYEGKEKGKAMVGSSENEFSGDEIVGEDLDNESVSNDELPRNMMSSKKASIMKKPKFGDFNSVEKEYDNDDDKVVGKQVFCFPSPQALGTSSPGEETSRTRGLGIDLNELPQSEEDGVVESENHALGTSSPGEEASRTRGLVIDLNELPPSEEDGGVESENHASYASSHNSDV